MTTDTLSTRIRALRQAQGRSQADLGRLVELGQNTIAGYESGRIQPSIPALVRLAAALGVTIDYLVGAKPPFTDDADDIAASIRALSPADRIAARKIIAALADRGKIHPQPSADGSDDSIDDSPATGNNKGR